MYPFSSILETAGTGGGGGTEDESTRSFGVVDAAFSMLHVTPPDPNYIV